MGAVVPIEVKINGEKVDDSNLFAVTIERDMFQPDMAAIVVSNQENVYSAKLSVGVPIEVSVGDDNQSIYKGELVGMEATYRGGEKSKLTVRGLNKMHRLLRKRKSLTFTDKTDQQIISQVVGDAGLSLEWKHEKSITYKHVYQHNLTDLEFVRMRAARLGCHVWCVDSKIYVKQPDLQSGPIMQLDVADAKESSIKSFTPRLSSASVVEKVTVKGWNPEKKELITATESIQSSKLGKDNAVAGSGSLANEETFTVDHPIWSKEEASALAKARLQDLALTFITGECECTGSAAYDLGKIVQITSNNEDSKDKDPFNGKYYIMGITHRYTVSRNKEGGYTTILKLARDAGKAG